MRYILAFAACLAAAPAVADYSDFPAGVIFTEKPCGQAVAAIDGDHGFEIMGQSWAIMLDYDNENGDMHDPETETLDRLRKACAESPETPAMELLRGFNQD